MHKKRIAICFFSVLPLIILCLVYQNLPDMVPMEWDINERVGYDDKWKLFLLAGINLLIGIGMPLLAKIDPKRYNYEKFFPVYENMILIIQMFMTFILTIVVINAFHPGEISVVQVIIAAVGLLLVLLGNMMPKLKTNYFTGFKTPWALNNEIVWNKTQRLGGKMFFFGGIFMMFSSFAFPLEAMTYWFAILMSIIVIVPAVMSYIWYQKELNSTDE